MSEYNYITEQHFWKRTQPRSCWCPVSFPLKPFVCSLKAEPPNPSSPSPCMCQSTAMALIWEMCAQLCPPTKSGSRGRAVREWCPGLACLMLHILQSRWGNRASFYWLSQETTRKPPFNFLPYPPASFRLAPRLGEWFFLKAIMKNSSSHSKSVLLWANSPCFSPFFPVSFSSWQKLPYS